MKVTFDKLDRKYIEESYYKYGEKQDIESIIFNCRGISSVKIGNLTLTDDLEVVIRIVEILKLADLCLNQSRGEFSFVFRFEPRVKVLIDEGKITFYDRANNQQPLEYTTLRAMTQLKQEVEEYVNYQIGSINPWLSKKIIDRQFN